MNNVLTFKSEGKKSVSIRLPEEPSEIAVNILNSQVVVPFLSTWDAVSKMLLLDFEDSRNSLDIEIKW